MSFLPAEKLQNISTKFAVGFGSFVDKVAYPYASTLQNGNDYMENHLSEGYVNTQYSVHVPSTQ